MPPSAPGRDRSIASTLALFCAFVGVALYLQHDLGAIRRLIDRAHGGNAEEDETAGPTFVQQEAARVQEETDDEVDDSLGGGDDGDDDDGEITGVAPTRVADASTDDTNPNDDTVRPVRTAIEDTCIDGTDDNCKQWAMDGFYGALTNAAAGTGLARGTLWGDSVSAGGTIAHGMRSKLDKTYGDGGAGFIFLAAPSRWYHNDAVRQSDSGWKIHSIIHNSYPGGYHGYGGAEFSGTSGDTATFKTSKSGAGSKVSHVELYYLQNPKGGTADILVDGEVKTSVDSYADDTSSGFTAVDVDDGAHTVEVKVTKGELDAFGVTMERSSGVVIDNVGMVSNTAKNLGDIKQSHWREQIAHRDADLMMILLGTNESNWISGPKSLKDYRKQWDKLLGSLRKGNPDGTCLVLGTLDAGTMEDGEFVPRKNLDGMIDVEREAAKANGCAFWDSRAFMGGKESSRKWRKKGLMSGDFAHLTEKGGKVLGGGIVEAIEAGYAASKKR